MDAAVKTATLLIVDDEPDNIAVLAGAMGADYEVLAATSGVKALELAARFQPDLILLDISMPGMDGYQVCHRLRQDQATRDIPVLFVTALDEEEFELRGLELGVMDYLTKPIRVRVVRQRIINALTLKLQRDQLSRQLARLEELNASLLQERETTKVLRGLIPICCVCKKIRNDRGYWSKLEQYITEHSEAEFSHGYCPECSRSVIEDYRKSRGLPPDAK